jgi:hypothetical protein
LVTDVGSEKQLAPKVLHAQEISGYFELHQTQVFFNTIKVLYAERCANRNTPLNISHHLQILKQPTRMVSINPQLGNLSTDHANISHHLQNLKQPTGMVSINRTHHVPKLCCLSPKRFRQNTFVQEGMCM